MSTFPAVRNFAYAVVDVFAERALEGNPLAIFTDARGLTDDEMQALARETNLAETTFILPSGDAAQEAAEGVTVRIFTTEEELPFAGHPTLGTAAWLHWNHPSRAGATNITLRLKGGPITVQFEPAKVDRPGVFGRMKQHDPVFGMIHEAKAISRVTGIDIADFDTSLPIQTVSTGLPFCVVPVRSLEALGRLSIPQTFAATYLAETDAKFFYVFAPADPRSGVDFRGRMQFYNGEDPATGSASGCAVAYLVHNKRVAGGKQTVLEQGVEMRRPSKIVVSASLTEGKVTDVFVSGRTIAVARGVFSLPR